MNVLLHNSKCSFDLRNNSLPLGLGSRQHFFLKILKFFSYFLPHPPECFLKLFKKRNFGIDFVYFLTKIYSKNIQIIIKKYIQIEKDTSFFHTKNKKHGSNPCLNYLVFVFFLLFSTSLTWIFTLLRFRTYFSNLFLLSHTPW